MKSAPSSETYKVQSELLDQLFDQHPDIRPETGRITRVYIYVLFPTKVREEHERIRFFFAVDLVSIFRIGKMFPDPVYSVTVEASIETIAHILTSLVTYSLRWDLTSAACQRCAPARRVP